jgi:hypothetical protein
MAQQPRIWQRKYLAQRKSFERVYFYPEAQLIPSQRVSRFSDGYTPVGYPGQWIPVVPVGSNPEASRRIADMLCALMRPFVPHAMSIDPVLADDATFAATGALKYIWTEEIMFDSICAHCGSIETIPHTLAEEDGLWLCGDCIDSGR